MTRIGNLLTIFALAVCLILVVGMVALDAHADKTKTEAAEAEGWQAGTAGLPVEACPYAPVTFDGTAGGQYSAWRKGWAAGTIAVR